MDWTPSQWVLFPLMILANGVVAISLLGLLGWPVLMVLLTPLRNRRRATKA